MTNWIEQALADAALLIEWLRRQEETGGVLTTISRRIADTLASGGRVLTCGNGGSMCDAMHFAEELSGRYRQDRAAFAAQAMSDPAHMSCVAKPGSAGLLLDKLRNTGLPVVTSSLRNSRAVGISVGGVGGGLAKLPALDPSYTYIRVLPSGRVVTANSGRMLASAG